MWWLNPHLLTLSVELGGGGGIVGAGVVGGVQVSCKINTLGYDKYLFHESSFVSRNP